MQAGVEPGGVFMGLPVPWVRFDYMGQLLNDLERGINIKIAASCISFIFVVVLGFVLLLRFVIKNDNI